MTSRKSAGAAKTESRKALGPVQLADRLGLYQWQFERLVAQGRIPARDRANGWSADVADQLAARAGELREQAGTVPDYGGCNAASYLAGRLGVTVTPNGIHELFRMGLLPAAGWYKGWRLYSGMVLETFSDLAAIAEAETAGRLLAGDQAAADLGIRRTDFDHLVRAGLIAAADHGEDRWGHIVPLYRGRELDALREDPRIDWPAIRATTARQRSPLAKLPTAPERRR